jgi:hypothetical protein
MFEQKYKNTKIKLLIIVMIYMLIYLVSIIITKKLS